MNVAVVLNGPKINIDIKEEYIICADGGYNSLQQGIIPSIILGDMDSIGKIPPGIENIIIPKVKDYTDGEFAIRYASRVKGVENIYIYGALGGRIDRILANLGLLKIASSLGKKAYILDKDTIVTYENKVVKYDVKKGDIISIFADGNKARLINGQGLFYKIDDLELTPFESVGISNIATLNYIKFEVLQGAVYLFRISKAEK